MSISSCKIILSLFSMSLCLFVQADGMVGACVWCVPNLGSGTLILRSTLGGLGVSTFGGDGCLYGCSTLVGTPGLFRWNLNRFLSCLSYSNCASTIFSNGTSGFVCSSASVMSTAAIMVQSTEDMNRILVWWGKNSTVSPTLSTLVVFTYVW